MARYRLSAPARADIAAILATSLERWGPDGRARYAGLIAAGLRAVAAAPDGSVIRERPELEPGLRSLHLKHVRGPRGVKAPVHVLYYRATVPDLITSRPPDEARPRAHAKGGERTIEVVRLLHERMEPAAHLPTPTGSRARRPRR